MRIAATLGGVNSNARKRDRCKRSLLSCVSATGRSLTIQRGRADGDAGHSAGVVNGVGIDLGELHLVATVNIWDGKRVEGGRDCLIGRDIKFTTDLSHVDGEASGNLKHGRRGKCVTDNAELVGPGAMDPRRGRHDRRRLRGRTADEERQPKKGEKQRFLH